MHKGLNFDGRLAPENSLDAINYTARVGARFIEIDINITKDGELVLLHDLAINERCYNSVDYTPVEGEDIYCNALTLSELRNNYVLNSDNPSMRRPVPTLEEALTICKIEGIYPYIEIKEDFFNKKDVKKAYETATRIMGKGNYCFTSFSAWIVEYLRDLDKDVILYRDMVEDTEYLKKYNINYYSHYEPSWYSVAPLYEKNIAEMHKAGLLASTWTVPKEAYDTIVAKGYDGILTDDIAPMFKPENAVFVDNSDGKFTFYRTNGILADNIVSLGKDQTLELKNLPIDSLFLGGLYFKIEAKGKFTIDANNFQVERENKADDYKIYHFQYLFHNERPFFRITALEDSLKIKSIWLAICDF